MEPRALVRVLRVAGAVEHWRHRDHLRIAIAAAMVGALIGSWPLLAAGPLPDAELIRRIVNETTRADVAITAVRVLRAGTLSGKHQGWMNIETTIDSRRGFTWKVIGEGGSERTRNKVFRELIKAESEAIHRGDDEAAALTPANYTFNCGPTSGAGRIEIGLEPRRADSRLIVGRLTVTEDGSLIRLEGRLAKPPSFWVKSVTIVKHFERIAGVTLPTELESMADVKFAGQSSFAMRYHYREVNGRVVSGARQPDDLSFNPSHEILALFRASASNR